MHLRVGAFAILAAASATSAFAQAPIASLHGEVVNAESGVGIGGARVMLLFFGRPPAAAGNRPPLRTTTAEDGTFAFAVDVEGTYRVWANASGYTVPLESVPFEVQSGQPLPDVVVRLSRGGEVSGSVSSPGASPTDRFVVTALRRRIESDGRIGTTMGPSAMVLPDGTFTLSTLIPGEYVVVARPQSPALAARRLPDGRLAMAPTYFPGTPDLAAAAPIVVRAGEYSRNLDFVVQPAAGLTVSGSVVDEAGTALARALLTLSYNPRNPTAGPGPPLTAFTDAAGHFAIDGATPGAYMILASMPRAAGPGDDAIIRGPDGTALSSSGAPPVSVDITVSDRDLQDIRIVLPRR